MLIHMVHANLYTYKHLFPYKRSLQPIGQSSFTLLGWFRLASIDQYSSLLPPVGVWTVSQFQCGGPSSQNPYPSLARWAVTPPTTYWNASPSLSAGAFIVISCNLTMLFGINLSFERLCQREGQVGYALLTRAPVVCRNRPRDLHVLSL